MIIQVDLEGRSVIEQLCDIALKEGGVKNLNAVNRILKSVVLLSKEKSPIEETPSPKSNSDEVKEKVEQKTEETAEQKEKKKTKKKKREPVDHIRRKPGPRKK